MTSLPFYDADAVEALLDYPGCIAAMRSAMTALSRGDRAQPLRQIVQLAPDRLFGVMPGDIEALSSFGAKLVSVFPDPARPGRTRHRGIVAAFDMDTGEPVCLADAEAVTHIRTACATAAATSTLARDDARVLAVFGAGKQAESHVRALRLVRDFNEILVWNRTTAATGAFIARMSSDFGITVTAVHDAREVAERADVICTVSGAREPILFGEWVGAGTHINLVGSSSLRSVEVDALLVIKSRYFADYRPGVLAQASELDAARRTGGVGDEHVVGEIGEVFAGLVVGRQSADQITVFKSLGHVVQDLAATAYLHSRAVGGTSK